MQGKEFYVRHATTPTTNMIVRKVTAWNHEELYEPRYWICRSSAGRHPTVLQQENSWPAERGRVLTDPLRNSADRRADDRDQEI